MKKSTKVLSIFLCIATLFSMFAISAGAVSSSSSKQEILTFYEKAVKTTATIDVIEATNTEKYLINADLSNLSASDRRKTTDLYFSYLDDDLGKENVNEYTTYFYGKAYGTDFDGVSEIENVFSVQRRIKDFGHKFNSASYKKQSNGDQTVVFNCSDTYEDGSKDVTKYTAVVNKYNVVISFKMESTYTETMTSVNGVDFKYEETMSDAYVFRFKNKANSVKSISLSETDVTIGYGDTITVDVIFNPKNADFKGFWIDDPELGDVVSITEDWDNSSIVIEGVDKGTTEITVTSYDGEKIATLNVTVEMNFFDMIIKFFRDLFARLFIF